MNKVISALSLGIITAVLISTQSLADTRVINAHEIQSRTALALSGKLRSVQDAITDGHIDESLKLIRAFDSYPLAPQTSEARLDIAERLREAHRISEAVEQLIFIKDKDPFCRVAPNALELLADIQRRDMGQNKEADKTLAKLATEYFPLNPAVERARSELGWNIPVVPKNKLILLDEQFGGPSIYDRSYWGSNNGGQWEVIDLLASAGNFVHVAENGTKIVPLKLLKQYKLIILNWPWGMSKAQIQDNEVSDFVEYVKQGGSLLVTGGTVGKGDYELIHYINPLLKQFDLGFKESDGVYANLDSTRVVPHKAVKDITNFKVEFGTPVTTTGNATVIGYCHDDPIIAVSKCGKGKVIVAGIGAFDGGTIGAINKDPEDMAATTANRFLLMSFVNYSLSSEK